MDANMLFHCNVRDDVALQVKNQVRRGLQPEVAICGRAALQVDGRALQLQLGPYSPINATIPAEVAFNATGSTRSC